MNLRILKRDVFFHIIGDKSYFTIFFFNRLYNHMSIIVFRVMNEYWDRVILFGDLILKIAAAVTSSSKNAAEMVVFSHVGSDGR